MVSNLKSETARANGAKSHGPNTPEGKEKSSRNALKHGLTAGIGNLLLDCEDPDEFEQTFNKLLGIHEPARPAERDLVEEMAASRWRIRRMWTIETGLLNAEILTQQSSPSVSAGDPAFHLASAFHKLADDSHSLALTSRYEARLQRTYDRAYKTLRELQQARKSEPPDQPQTVHVKWVDRKDEPDEIYNPSAGETGEPNPSAAANSEPRASASGPTPKMPNEPTAAANPTEPRASASGPTPKIPNEPTAAANKEVSTPISQPVVPVFENIEPPSTRNPKSEIPRPNGTMKNNPISEGPQ